MSVADALAAVCARIERAAKTADRDPATVTLVAVSKTVPLDRVRAAVAAGAVDLGENRAQELVAKATALAVTDHPPRWHFIGNLQRNKVRALAPHVTLWQSVDRAEIADAIAQHAPRARVLVQVNVSGEAQKHGCAPEAAAALAAHCVDRGLEVEGLMTIPEAAVDPVPSFRLLRRLTDELGLPTCSMGMSGDYEMAIAAGSTMVRVGTAVFGPRPASPDARR